MLLNVQYVYYAAGNIAVQSFESFPQICDKYFK